MMHLLLLLAPLAQEIPVAPAPSGTERSEPILPLGLGTPVPEEPEAQALETPGPATEATEGQPAEPNLDPGLDPELQEDLVPEAPAAEPWQAPDSDSERAKQLGPWPDGYAPPAGRLDMLPTVDPVTGRVLDVGTPMEGELQGPQAPESGQEAVMMELPVPKGPVVAPVMPEPAPAPAAPIPEVPVQPVQVVTSPPPEPTPAPQLWPFAPPSGGQSFSRSAMWFIIATLAVVLGRWIDGTKTTLPSRGLLPAVARVMEVVCRIAALIAVLFGTMRLVPDAYFQYFPVVLVAASVAVGWSARDVLHDVLAGVLLVVEHRLVPEMRVEADGRVGTVINVGFRSVSMESDDGQIIRIPNRDFLSTDTRVDKDPYAPVEVVVEAPHGARRRLEEIALASPLVAPGHPPEVFRDPEHPERWVVRARLVHPRWTLAFRGAVQDRLEAG